ncbi:hypothetical protein [Kluyvera ascorbata]|uniref:hypothetical protein n=1 Tax=Kluyvera ascorbata TaxID=51288 RepID=UPI002DBF780E|nr:hypothetical protein [Kluyvera ascorbata]MEB6390939.1 hypothetical protein [Kluyvera ascorbata]
MSSNSEIFKKIQASLQAARDTIKLKDRIEDDINDVMSVIPQLTNDAVSFVISGNNYDDLSYNACNKIITITKKSNPYYKFILCGYSIDENNGYPVTVETKHTLTTCADDENLKLLLTDLITEKETSMRIVNLISMDDIPF